MKTISVFLILILLFSISTFGQEKDVIVQKRRGYFQNEKKLTNKELKTILSNDPASAQQMKKSRTLQTIGITTQTVVQVGVIAATLFDPAGILVGTLGGFLVGLPFTIPAGKQFDKAITSYNKSKLESSTGETISEADFTNKIKSEDITKNASDTISRENDSVEAVKPKTPANPNAKQAKSNISSDVAAVGLVKKDDASILQKLNFSAETGFVLSKLSAENKSDYARFKPGFRVGGLASYGLNEKMAVQSGLFFHTKGIAYKTDVWNSATNLNYLELPVNGIYKINVEGKDVFLNAGPYLGLSLGGKRIAKNDDQVNKTKLDPGLVDVGINVGAKMRIKSYTVGIQYGHGFIDVFSNESKNRTMSLNVGYFFDFSGN
ncbi:MAG: PorT family protein [Bacteroidetes bacterium]|nr:MAG: PorT family protein [Bacteroidota bacterium]